MRIKRGVLDAGAGLVALLALGACGGGASAAPSAASIAARLGCRLAGADQNAQNSYDTTAYDLLTGPSRGGSLCAVRGSETTGDAEDVIIFASQAKETDWLHQNDVAQAGGALSGSGYVGLVAGSLWVVTDGSGVVGLGNIAAKLPGGKAVTTF